MKLPSVIPILLSLVACSPVGPDYEGAPDMPFGENFTGSTRTDPALDRWWRGLGSTELNGLVADCLEHNHDLAIATERLREARALRKQAAAAFLPQATGNLSFTRQNFGEGDGGFTGEINKSGFIPDPLDYWSAGADVSWEIDIFGGRRREAAGAAARAEAAREALHGVRLAIIAETVESYFTLAGLREQLTTVKRQVKLQEDRYQDMRERESAGAASKLDIDRTRSRLEQTRLDLPPLQSGITSQLRRLSLLLGAPPNALDQRNIATKPLPRRLPMIRTGLPAELVMRRPDLRQAERELAAATEDIGVATANFYPRFSLIGNPSASTTKFGDLFKPRSFDLEISPGISWSIFSGGRNRAILEAANSRQKQALYRYEKAVLKALGEVESDLAALRAEQQRLAFIQRAREAAASSVKRVRESAEAGAVDHVDVLTEEERLREAEIAEIRIKSQLILVWTRFHKALGGGWKAGG